MASAWGFDISNAVDFTGTLPEVAAWQTAVDALLFKESYAEAIKETEAHISAARGSGNALSEATALCVLTKVYLTQNSLEQATQFATQALQKFVASGNVKGEALALFLQAKIALEANDLAKVADLAQQASEKFRACNARAGEAAVHHTLARMHNRSSNVDEALAEADKALKLFEKTGDKEGQAAAKLVKGNAYMWNYQNAQEDAMKMAREAASLCSRVKKPSSQNREGDAQFLVACAALQLSNHQDGLKAATSSLALFSEWGGPRAQASAMRAVALGHMQGKALKEAMEVAGQAVAAALATGDVMLIGEARVVDAMVHRHAAVEGSFKDLDRMVQKARDVLDIFMELKDEQAAALHRLELAHSLLLANDKSGALAEATIACDVFKANGNSSGEGMCMLTMAQLAHIGGDTPAALAMAEAAKDLITEPSAKKEASELVAFMKQKIKDKAAASAPPPAVPAHESTEGQGIKRSQYSMLIKRRFQTPDTHDELVFDTELMLYMDKWLGSAMPFLRGADGERGKDPTLKGRGQGGRGPPPPPKPAAQAPAAAPAPAAPKPQGSLGDAPASPAPGAKAKAPSGPLVIKPAVVGNDLLGGRYRDVPENVHSKMVSLAKAGVIVSTTLAQRSMNERKKPTFYGHQEWKEAVKYGYIHPNLTAPKGCKWQKGPVGMKLVGPSPLELLPGGGGANENVALQAVQGSSPNHQQDHVSIEKLLCGARPDWTATECAAARRKLESVEIKSGSGLMEELNSLGCDGLNDKLRERGEKAFKPQTLQALRAYGVSLANAEPWLGPAAGQFALYE